MANFLTEASEIQNDLAAIRRHIHQEPEIGLDLPKTQAKVIAALEGLGLEISTGKSLTSVTAVLRNILSKDPKWTAAGEIWLQGKSRVYTV